MHDSPQLDQSLKSASTKGLFMSLCFLTVAAPALSAAVFFGYMHYTGEVIEKSDIKQLAMYTWLATLGAMFLFALRHRRYGATRPARRSGETEVVFHPSSPGARAEAWEDRHSRRIIQKLLVGGLFISAVLGAALWGYLPTPFKSLDLHSQRQVIGGIWIAGLVIIAYVGVRVSRTRITMTARSSESSAPHHDSDR